MKLYDVLNNVEDEDGVLEKDFKDLTAEDIANDNVVYLINNHICQIKGNGMVPKHWYDKGFNQESPYFPPLLVLHDQVLVNENVRQKRSWFV